MSLISKKKQKIIIGNWKLNPQTIQQAHKLFTTFLKQKHQTKNVTTVVCPPSLFINDIRKMYAGSKIFFGAQNCSSESEGAHTGEISPEQIASIRCRFVIIGHSERRALGETNEQTAKKVAHALKTGLHVVLCIGEQEQKTDGSHLHDIEKQLTESLAGVSKTAVKNLIVAYEPVWAIGKGKKAMDAHAIHQMTLFIRKILLQLYGKKASHEISIIYGGSSNSTNAAEIVTEGGVDGLLPGRASLDPVEFSNMIDAISKAANEK